MKVVYYDQGLSFGGTLMLLKMIFNQIPREQVTPRLIASAPHTTISKHFDDSDIALVEKRFFNYAKAMQWEQRAKRFYFSKRLAAYCYSVVAFVSGIVPSLKLFFTLVKERPDVLHVNNSTTPLFSAFILRIPVIWHIHGVPPKMGRVERALLRQVKLFIAISDFIKHSSVQAGYPEHKILTILNPAPNPSHEPKNKNLLCLQHNIDPKNTIVLHMARLVPWKGQLAFLKAFKIALQSDSHLYALVGGDDDECLASDYKQQMLDYITENNLEENIKLVGQVDNPMFYMTHADIFVHSSLEPEPFGLVITEAMSAGTAVIASRLGAPSEIILDNTMGRLADPDNPSDLAAKICELSSSESLRASLIVKCRKRIDALSLERYQLRLNSEYKKIIEQKF